MSDADDPGLTAADRELMRSAQTGDGLIRVGPDELVRLARAARARKDEFDETFASMTREQAEFVRRLRVEQDYSWRAVAETCHLEWGGGWDPPSNQLAGMAICQRAAAMHGEQYMAEPWN